MKLSKYSVALTVMVACTALLAMHCLQLHRDYKALCSQYTELQRDHTALSLNYMRLRSDYEVLSSRFSGLQADYERLSEQYSLLHDSYSKLETVLLLGEGLQLPRVEVLKFRVRL